MSRHCGFCYITEDRLYISKIAWSFFQFRYFAILCHNHGGRLTRSVLKLRFGQVKLWIDCSSSGHRTTLVEQQLHSVWLGVNKFFSSAQQSSYFLIPSKIAYILLTLRQTGKELKKYYLLLPPTNALHVNTEWKHLFYFEKLTMTKTLHC